MWSYRLNEYRHYVAHLKLPSFTVQPPPMCVLLPVARLHLQAPPQPTLNVLEKEFE